MDHTHGKGSSGPSSTVRGVIHQSASSEGEVKGSLRGLSTGQLPGALREPQQVKARPRGGKRKLKEHLTLLGSMPSPPFISASAVRVSRDIWHLEGHLTGVKCGLRNSLNCLPKVIFQPFPSAPHIRQDPGM